MARIVPEARAHLDVVADYNNLALCYANDVASELKATPGSLRGPKAPRDPVVRLAD
jgi:hypothetical protein